MTAAAAEPPALPVSPGTILAGKYRVEGVLGQGAMGVVVAATPLTGGEPVAIKLVLPEALERDEALARFSREVQIVRKLQSRHIARVLDAGTHDDGSPYMAIEYLTGHELTQELRQRGPLPVAEAVDHVLQALEAITEAHAAGIVHRDVKPGNLFLARQPDGSSLIKVLDFGISKQAGDPTAVALTKTQTLIGSPLYMSPEQVLEAKNVSARSDLWSLGVVLFELLTGKTPFDGVNVGTVLSNVLSAPLPSLRELRPDAPAGLDEVLRRCIERNPTRRIASGVALARALAPYASDASAAARARIESFAPLFPEAEPPPEATPHRQPSTNPPPSSAEPGVTVSLPGTPGPFAGRTSTPSPPHPSPRGDDSLDEALPRPSPLRGPLIALLIVLSLLAAAVLAAKLTAP